MKSKDMDDLFGHVPQSEEEPAETLRSGDGDMVPDHVDADLGMMPRVHTKESIRQRMLGILEKARNAETNPFTPRQMQSHTGLFPVMAEWLEEDGEGERLLAEFRAEIDKKLLRTVAADPTTTNTKETYKALAFATREQLAARWVKTQLEDRKNKARRIYYMSMEFLIGRALNNALYALGTHDQAAAAFNDTHGPSLNEIIECEPDAALGNGGLGRLAACFLDSMATLELPSWGYGMRYEYGMFAQSVVNGTQIEHPDSWLVDGTPWEIPRPGTVFPVRFGGTAEHHGEWAEWNAAEAVEARAFDYVIPGYATERVSTLRLWKATAPAHIDLNAFNFGDYARAAEFKNRFGNISWVLYPNDSTPAGRELRLR